jgi:hypothetical protein
MIRVCIQSSSLEIATTYVYSGSTKKDKATIYMFLNTWTEMITQR